MDVLAWKKVPQLLIEIIDDDDATFKFKEKQQQPYIEFYITKCKGPGDLDSLPTPPSSMFYRAQFGRLAPCDVTKGHQYISAWSDSRVSAPFSEAAFL